MRLTFIPMLTLSATCCVGQALMPNDITWDDSTGITDNCPSNLWINVIPPMVTDSTNGITLSASSIFNDGFHFLWSPVQGFEDGDGWMASDNTYPQWWQIQFASSVIGKEYAISIHAGGLGDFTDVVVAGSNNGSTWINIQTNNIAHGNGIVTNSIINTIGYTYYRFTQDNWTGLDAPQNATVNYIQLKGCQ